MSEQDYQSSREWHDRRETALLRDVSFNRHSMQDGKHVSPNNQYIGQIGEDGIVVKLVQGLNPEFQTVLSKAQRATIGINLEKTDPDNRDWEEMLQGGLQTALESQVVVFEVSGVSRACTHQIVRTRKAAFHQQSMRASFYGPAPEFRIPESIWRQDDAVRHLWIEAMEAAHVAYQAACDADVSYQDARYILPEGTTNYILMEYPLREFINVYAYRGCSMFQWEIVSVMRAAREILVAKYPFLDPYIKISCEKTKGSLDLEKSREGMIQEFIYQTRIQDPECSDEEARRVSAQAVDDLINTPGTAGHDHHAHHCTFQGWENVEGQCPFPWARESNRAFRSQHHRIEKDSGRKE